MMLAGGCLMVESSLVDVRTSGRLVQVMLAAGGFTLAVVGVMLRRAATRQTQP
jgi:hypothetical protein